MIAIFETGKTYTTKSAGDYGCIFTYTIVRRTAKRITLRDEAGGLTTRGIYIYDNSECCKPEGSYSIAPVIRADKL